MAIEIAMADQLRSRLSRSAGASPAARRGAQPRACDTRTTGHRHHGQDAPLRTQQPRMVGRCMQQQPPRMPLSPRKWNSRRTGRHCDSWRGHLAVQPPFLSADSIGARGSECCLCIGWWAHRAGRGPAGELGPTCGCRKTALELESAGESEVELAPRSLDGWRAFATTSMRSDVRGLFDRVNATALNFLLPGCTLCDFPYSVTLPSASRHAILEQRKHLKE